MCVNSNNNFEWKIYQLLLLKRTYRYSEPNEEEEDKPCLAPLSNKCEPKADYYFSWQANTLTKKKTLGMIWQSLGHIWTIHVCGNGMGRLSDDCVRGTRTQPLICVGCSVHYWVSCAINKGGFFEIAFVVVVDTHLPRFEELAYVCSRGDSRAFKRLLRSCILSS